MGLPGLVSIMEEALEWASQHAGMVILADGSEDMEKRL